MSTTEKRGVKRKLNHKTIEFKYQAITEVEKKTRPQTEIAKELGISTSTLSTWMANKETIKKGFLDFGPKRKNLRTGKWEELESALLKWFQNARDQGAVISGAILMEKANEFAQRLDIDDFSAKSGWLTRFKDRNGISFKSICGESKSVDDSSENMKEWWSRLESLLREYSPDCIYNADETGIFYKMLPDKTYEFKNIDCHGGKRSKERLTALVCANMSGTDKLPLFIIGKAAKPRCFKNRQVLPTQYTANKKAWMTSEIFMTWLKELDAKMKKKNKKIAMIVDNCPAHPNMKSLTNVELVFLPKNTTSKTQPMDQGVINNLKVHYRKRIVLRQINAIEKKQDFSITVLDALRLLRDAWDSVTAQTVQNCFRHAGFTDKGSEASTVTDSEDDDELDDIPLSRLAAYNNRAMLSDFVNFDEDLPTSAPVTDDEIVSDILMSRQPADEDNDDAEDDDTGPITTPPTVDQAMDALETLNNFYECCGNTEEELVILNGLRRKMLRRKVTEMGRRRQSSIMDFMVAPSNHQ